MAYAAVVSLKRSIHSLHNPTNQQITKSTYEELNFLDRMLKRLDDRSKRGVDRSVMNGFDSKITEVVWKLQDVVESKALLISNQRLEWGRVVLDGIEIEIEIDSFLKRSKELREEYNRELQNPLSGEEDEVAISPTDVEDLGGNKSTTVGLSDLYDKIRKEVLGWQSELKTVSLVGMAGIGKTHLATQIYHHPLIVKHFDSRVWVSVGPKDRVNNISLDIVAQIEGKPRDLFKGKSERSLRDLLRNSLRTRRYLIVLDDIWSTQVLDYFKDLIPDYGKRCRFLLTTRSQEVAKYYQRAEVHQMPFLNNEESWNLLWQNVFVGENTFPHQLEKPGRKIAENCEGLPLLILAVANILRGLDKTEEYWNKVAEDKTNTFTDAYDQIYEVLLSSYEYLPQHLKPCFLYMGVFRKRCEIPTSKLFNLWDVEEFLETVATESLQDLVSNSLAIVCKWSFERFRRVKSLKLHSAYWHLCVKEARKNKFYHVLKKLADVSIEGPRRLSFQNNVLLGLNEVYELMDAVKSPTTRSLLCTGEDHQYPVRICWNMMLLKVLDALALRFYEFPDEVLTLLQLRYLSLTHNGELPSSINKLQHLQCLILRRHHNIKFPTASTTYLPDGIWDIELRHLRIMGSNLPDPLNDLMLQCLATLYVDAYSCRENVLRNIPNLRKLGITIELQPDAAETIRCLEHIGLVKKLKSLKCVVVNPRLRSRVVAPPDHLSNLSLCCLKKLSLKGLGYPWKYMTAIGSLPNLKVLKLRCSAFEGPHWEIGAGQFQNLESLLLEDIDLVHWTAQPSGNNKYLPNFSHLIIRHCYKLKMISLQIGDLPYMRRIEVDDCSPSVVDYAEKIKAKKHPCHQVVINSSWNL